MEINHRDGPLNHDYQLCGIIEPTAGHFDHCCHTCIYFVYSSVSTTGHSLDLTENVLYTCYRLFPYQCLHNERHQDGTLAYMPK